MALVVLRPLLRKSE
ncbi:hypothetical protein QU763_26560 [Escherichia coli]|nr:hypothetical protein [Escherichia coli]